MEMSFSQLAVNDGLVAVIRINAAADIVKVRKITLFVLSK